MNIEEIQELLSINAPAEDLVSKVRQSPSTPLIIELLRRQAPDLTQIPQTTYTLYRQFEHSGWRDGYQKVYYARRAMLTRAVLEMMLGDDSLRDVVQDLLWSICEETTWVLPAHEEQGPEYWDIHPPIVRTTPLGAHTALTREPDAIDLFSAETGASLAETIYWLGDRLEPEVVQRVRQEVERHIFKPYLAYGRKHWWFKGALNWNGVCNGSIGLAFMRLERDPRTLAEAIAMVLEGFEAYIATGFEQDGGSVEGIGYWNYGLMYFVTLAELLRERTAGKLDLLADPRLVKVAHYPLAVALRHGTFIAFGDATEDLAIEPGIAQRLSERTGVTDLMGLIVHPKQREGKGVIGAKLAINLRDAAWWDGEIHPFPASAFQDYDLPDYAVVKFVGQTAAKQPVILAAKAGHNDGHHSHTDVGSFLLNIDGENLLCDPGRGHYSREYFRQTRYGNIFNNSIGHNLPRIGNQLQAAGPEFGGRRQFQGAIISQGLVDGHKQVAIDFHKAYDLPALLLARRTLALAPETGEFVLDDHFVFDGERLAVEEGLVTWLPVKVEGAQAQIQGACSTLELTVEEPAGAVFKTQSLEEDCQANHREGVLTRLVVELSGDQSKETASPEILFPDACSSKICFIEKERGA